MSRGRILRIFRDGRRFERTQLLQLPTGAEGNLVTLAEMAKIVREDVAQFDIQNFVRRTITGKGSIDQQIQGAFDYCRDEIVFEPEQPGYETIADLWSALFSLNPDHGVGDCAIKSVALATCLGCLNLKPYFVAIKQIPNANFFNHVFVAIWRNGREIALDATPTWFTVGKRLDGIITRLNYPIFK